MLEFMKFGFILKKNLLQKQHEEATILPSLSNPEFCMGTEEVFELVGALEARGLNGEKRRAPVESKNGLLIHQQLQMEGRENT